jgi:hypothetical protein
MIRRTAVTAFKDMSDILQQFHTDSLFFVTRPPHIAILLLYNTDTQMDFTNKPNT